MFIYNGTDYTLCVFAALSAVLLFAVQYFLCAKARSKALKFSPSLYVVLILILAAVCLVTPDTSGFIDLSSAVALLLCIYAAICLIAVLAALALFRFKRKK